jgi:hypothetical protein
MLQSYVSSVSDICSKISIHLDIAKVDLGVAHVAMVTHMFQAHVSFSSIFRRMLQMFHLDVLK